MGAMVVVIGLEIQQSIFQICTRPEQRMIQIFASNRTDEPFHERMGRGNVGDGFDFCHLHDPQIGLAGRGHPRNEQYRRAELRDLAPRVQWQSQCSGPSGPSGWGIVSSDRRDAGWISFSFGRAKCRLYPHARAPQLGVRVERSLATHHRTREAGSEPADGRGAYVSGDGEYWKSEAGFGQGQDSAADAHASPPQAGRSLGKERDCGSNGVFA